MEAGARQAKACEVLGLDPRTIQRWRKQGGGEDRRNGPVTAPANALSGDERAHVLRIVNSPKYRDLSPKQIVPMLADEGTYIASESTIYRILRGEDQATPRTGAARPVPRPKAHTATGPGQLMSWDITYLKSPVRGAFYFLYMFVDVWSRKIVGWRVHHEESMEHAAALVREIAEREGIEPDEAVLHADNGGPMKGATMKATLEALGIAASFSRPRVSDDNPYSESLFRTLKYRPEYPRHPFATIGEARSWVAAFVDWYNLEHRHSSIGFVTPEQRHTGCDTQLLARRRRLYDAARQRNPNRWSGKTRAWTHIDTVVLNKGRSKITTTAVSMSEAA